MQKDIKHTWHFNQSPEIVWAYLTQPDLLEQWLGQSDFQPIKGHKFRITGKQGSKIYCEVLEVNRSTKLSYSWQAKSANSDELFNSTVVWTLIRKENGTELQLLHTGFITLEDFTAHNTGWTILGDQLVELLKCVES